MNGLRRRGAAFGIAVGAGVLLSSGVARGQSLTPAVFVANNGNLEGSVSSFRVEGDGSLGFVSRVVLGTRSTLSENCPGCNPVEISLSPNGRWLATTHASGSDFNLVTVYEVFEDGSIIQAGSRPVAFSSLGLAWVTDALFVQTNSTFGSTNQVILNRWDAGTGVLSAVDSEASGGFTTSLQAHPNGQWFYSGDSDARLIRAWRIDSSSESISLIEAESTGATYPLGLGLSPDGKWLYGGGGISNGGNKFVGYAVQADGSLEPIKGSPFTSPGASPKGFAFSHDGTVLFVQHGTDATVRAFTIDPVTGVPVSTGEGFDVGLQGTLGDAQGLGARLYVTDETTAIDGVRGVYAFDVDGTTGALTQIGAGPVETGGITPETITAWAGSGDACPADLAGGDGVLNIDDVLAFVDAFAAMDPIADVAPPSGVFDIDDVLAYLDAFAAGCPG